MKNEIFYDLIDNRINELSNIFKDNEHLKKQNEYGKKSFSFLFWFLERYLPKEELSVFENYITEGNDDSSCDIIFNNIDQNGNEIFYVVQAKWFSKKNINKSNEITKEIKACLTDFQLILSGKKSSKFNQNFNTQYINFLAHKRKNKAVKFIFLALCDGDVNINEYIDNFVNSLVSFELIDFYKLKEQFIEIEYKGVRTHNPIETPYIPKSEFELEFEEKQVIYIDRPFKSNIFLVRPIVIYQLFEKYGHSLFYKNIRNPLPNSHFNEEIKNTILNNSINFWYFNNGITAITDKISDFYPNSKNVSIKGIQVINGAQTVFSIYQAYKYATKDIRTKMNEEGLVTLRVVTTGGQDFDLKVTRFTNSQNPINERDFHSNDDVQKRLQLEFYKYTNIWYETRRGEFRKKPKEVTKLTNEILAQTYLAYYLNDPFNAKQSKKLIFIDPRVLSNGLYQKIFNDDTKYDDMLISYYLYLLIDRKRKAIKKQIDSIDTTQLTNKEEELLKYDFIQYANFELLALFKILFYNIHKSNLKEINGKIISYFEKGTIGTIGKSYEILKDYIKTDLLERKLKDSKIVNSVIFKSKEYYPSLKNKFEKELDENVAKYADLKL